MGASFPSGQAVGVPGITKPQDPSHLEPPTPLRCSDAERLVTWRS